MFKLRHAAIALALGLAFQAHAEPIRVGVALDISGPFATIGAETRDGLNLAIEKLGGRLGGEPAEFLQQDFAGNPEQAKQLVTRFLQRDRIDFFTGPVASNSALAVGPALFAARVPYLSSNPGPSVFAGKQCNPFFFAPYQNDTYDEAAGKVANDKGYRNVVLIAPNYPAGKDHLNGFKRTYKGTVKDEIYTKVGQLDYAAEIAQIRAAKPDAVFFFLPAAMGINFVKQYGGAGLIKEIPLLAPAFSAEQDAIDAVGEPMLGILNTAHWAADLKNPANAEFVAAFAKKYNGRTPTVYAAQAYDVVMAMDAAVREVKGKVADRDAVIAALRKANFASVRGPFSYGVNNFPVQNYYLRVVDRDGGRIRNKLVSTVMEKHQDAYVGDCRP